MNNIKVEWNEYGKPIDIKSPSDSYQMNWLSSNYKTGDVRGFDFKYCEKTSSGVRIIEESADGVQLTINRKLYSNKYIETYTFSNCGKSSVTLNKDFGAISYAGNSFFDKQPNMLFTRCNTHIFTGEDITYLYSVKLCGKPPYLCVRAEAGSFSGYGLAADISITPIGAFDRGQIWLFPKAVALAPNKKISFKLNYYFSNRRPENYGFHCNLDKYSLFMGETVKLTVHTARTICNLSVTCSDENVTMNVNKTTACGILVPKKIGEHIIKVTVNGKKTLLSFNVLPKLSQILAKRAAFICRKQQCMNADSPLYGAYLIYDKETGNLVCRQDFPDNNSARERLSMGVTVAIALQQNKNRSLSRSIKLYRDFLEREIVNVKTGEVRNGINDARMRLYNYPWVSTFYFELYKANGDITALQTAADVMIHYYSIGGENMESHVEVHRLLPYLKKEGLETSYRILLSGFIKHADSILARRNDSSSPEVSCANGMMSMMGVILINAFLLTNDRKYLAPIKDLADIVGNFYALQPDFHCYGMAVRYWDLYWFGKSRLYGDTFPQWLSANTAEFYSFYDKAFQTNKHSRIIREILLGCCSVYDKQGFGSCGYLYPDEVIAYSSNPMLQEKHRPLGKHNGKFYDSFANDQDWSLYYAYTLLPKKYFK